MTESTPEPALIVLDTNVVLDWLVFRDPFAAALGRALDARRVRWVATASMRAELTGVLAKPALAGRAPDRATALQVWDALVVPCPEPPAQSLRCRDAADQVFFDLALATRARWLVTRDRALLELARHAARAGTHIVQPLDWSD